MPQQPKNNPSISKSAQIETSKPSQSESSNNDRSDASKTNDGGDEIERLKQRHKELKTLLANNDDTATQPMERVKAIARLWVPHALVEEEILYPAVGEKTTDQAAIKEAQVRRDLVKILLRDLLRDAPEAEFFQAKLSALRAELDALMKLEDKPTHGLLALAAANGVDMEALRPRIAQMREQFDRDAKEDSMHLPAPVPFAL